MGEREGEEGRGRGMKGCGGERGRGGKRERLAGVGGEERKGGRQGARSFTRTLLSLTHTHTHTHTPHTVFFLLFHTPY